MVNRKRPIYKKVRLNEIELQIIQKKMHASNSLSFEGYARKMMLDGLIVHKDFSHLQELISQISRIGNNINQIAKKVNGTGNFSRDDLRMMQINYHELTKELNSHLLQLIYEDRQDR